jgi:hypothetical protein
MTENQTIEASYQVTVEELFAAHAMATKVLNKRRPWLLREKPGSRVVAGLMVVLTFMCLALSLVFGFGSSGQHLLLGVFLALSLLVFCLPWIVKAILKRRFEKMPALGKTAHFSIDADGVSMRTEGLTDGTNKWPAYLYAARTTEGYLLVLGNQIYNWLPNHAFASDREADEVAFLASRHAAEYLDMT